MTDFGGTSVPTQYQAQITASAARWGISPAVLAAQLDAESGFNPNSVSSAGAVGIAQFLPSTAKANGVDPYNVNQAIDGMAMLDARYLKQFGSIQDALAAYNAGPGAVSKYAGIPPFAETQNYVKKILAAAGSAITANGAGLGLVDAQGVSLTDPLSSLTKLFGNLLNVAWWKRAGVGVIGVGLLIAGLYFMMAKQPGSFNVQKQIEGVIK
jgi:hypothetical protein